MLFVLLVMAGGAALTPQDTSLGLPSMLRKEDSNRRLVVLIHGWNGSAKGTWANFSSFLAADKSLQGCDIWVLDYPAFVARRPGLNIKKTASWIRRNLPTVVGEKKYEKAVIIAHSMGGVISRELCLGAIFHE